MLEIQIQFPTYTQWVSAERLTLETLSQCNILSYRQIGNSAVIKDDYEEKIIKILNKLLTPTQ